MAEHLFHKSQIAYWGFLTGCALMIGWFKEDTISYVLSVILLINTIRYIVNDP